MRTVLHSLALFFVLTLGVALGQRVLYPVVPGGGGGGGASAFSDLTDIGCATVTFSATPTFPAAGDNCFELTLTGNVTSSTLSGETPGQSILLRLKQDGAGGHTFVYPAEVVGSCEISQTADATTEILLFVSSGGAAIQACNVPLGPSAWMFESTDPANVETPGSGFRTIFSDSTNSGAMSAKTPAGSTVSLEAAGGGGSAEYDPTAVFDTAYFADEFPCTAGEDGEGMLPWGVIGSPNPNGCALIAGRPTGNWVLRPNTGNAIMGVRLGAASGNTGQTSSDFSTLDFTSVWRLKIEGTSETFYRIGWAVDAYAESYDATASGAFAGIQFQSNTSNCGTTLSHTNWQALVRRGANTAGFQDLGVAPSTSTWLWLRIRRTATPGVEVCIDQTDGEPDFTGTGSGCYEETTADNIPDSGSILAPTMIASSCDGDTLGPGGGLLLDYFALKEKRF